MARLARSALLVAAALPVALAACGSRPEEGSAQERAAVATTNVAIDVRARRQEIHGFGSSERVWGDPHVSNTSPTSVPAQAQAAILTSLYRRLGLTRVRPVLDQGIQRARGGSFNFAGKLTDDHVAFVRQAERYGLRTFFPAPVYLEDWMQPNDPDGYVDYAMGVLERWRALGAEPAFYSPINEPEIARDFPAEWLRDVVIRLGERLRAAGFRTKLVIPDDLNPVEAYRRAAAVLADPRARPHVGALAYHLYREGGPADYARFAELAAQHGLPVWMTEYFDRAYSSWPGALRWAVTMHELITAGRVSAVDYLWGFFGSWEGRATLISIDFDGGDYRRHFAMPVYYLTGQFSRYVRPGYRRVRAEPSGAGPVLTSAYTGPGRLVVVAINTSSAAQPLRLSVRGARLRGRVEAVRTSRSERWLRLRPVRMRGSRISARLAPGSVTTFVVRRR
jgi:glucuronoarabinoxylan endo-1,4-beta-xylanase